MRLLVRDDGGLLDRLFLNKTQPGAFVLKVPADPLTEGGQQRGVDVVDLGDVAEIGRGERTRSRRLGGAVGRLEMSEVSDDIGPITADVDVGCDVKWHKGLLRKQRATAPDS